MDVSWTILCQRADVACRHEGNLPAAVDFQRAATIITDALQNSKKMMRWRSAGELKHLLGWLEASVPTAEARPLSLRECSPGGANTLPPLHCLSENLSLSKFYGFENPPDFRPPPGFHNVDASLQKLKAFTSS